MSNEDSLFEYRGGELFCEEVALREIAEKTGTPAFVYSGNSVRRRYRQLKSAFSRIDPTICYAVKANSNLAILEILTNVGSCFDIVSAGELFRLNRSGVSGDRIIFSGVGKTDAELEAAIDQSLFCLVIESLSELQRVSELTRTRGKSLRISLRLNPEVEARTHPYISTGLRRHKFGIELESLAETLAMIKENELLELQGIGSHIGSQILEVSPFVEAFRRIRESADEIRSKGFPVQHLDLGGGFGIPYRKSDPVLDLSSLAQSLEKHVEGYKLLMEPGRYLVGPAGVLLARVLHRKSNHGKNFVVADAAMNDLIRPALYQAYHEIVPVREAEGAVMADVVGPVCESADFLGHDRRLPELRPGDLLAVMDSGAYGFVASSNYNSRPRIAEVLVEGKSNRVIRKRETFEDLIRGEI
jgi:diaminopimelate decarboxylase